MTPALAIERLERLASGPCLALARNLAVLLRDDGGWHSTGGVAGMAAARGWLDASDVPLLDTRCALDVLADCGHVDYRAGKASKRIEWAVTTACEPLPGADGHGVGC